MGSDVATTQNVTVAAAEFVLVLWFPDELEIVGG
jgi:hypothetical protein